jgi:hypothetical protein
MVFFTDRRLKEVEDKSKEDHVDWYTAVHFLKLLIGSFIELSSSLEGEFYLAGLAVFPVFAAFF